MAISDQYYPTFFVSFLSQNAWPKISFDRISRHFKSIRNFNCFGFFSQNGCRWPFWMTENHFWSNFSPFQINTQLFFLIFSKWLPVVGGHFGWPKITFNRISHHFRSIRNLDFFFTKRLPFGWPKITFDHISHHFRSISNFLIFFSKWPPVVILEVRLKPKTIGFFPYVLSMAMPNMKLIGDFMTKIVVREATSHKQRPFCFSDWCQK